MADVVLVRGVNVGGRRFRPTLGAEELRHLDVTNVGAAGTFVVRRAVARATLRAKVAELLPFEAVVAICDGSELRALVADDPWRGTSGGDDVVRFVSLLAGAPREARAVPFRLPADGRWLVRVLARRGQLLAGAYRRHMRTIGVLGELDRIYGVPVTTRSLSTVESVLQTLGDDGT